MGRLDLIRPWAVLPCRPMPSPQIPAVIPQSPTVDPNRRSIRLRGYDYARTGGYFVTVCIHERQHLLGRVVEGAVELNDLGRIVEEEWRRSAQVRQGVTLDVFVIMPNHLHGIVILDEIQRATVAHSSRAFGKPISGSLSTIIGQFKASATSRVNAIRGSQGARLWQRNFFETIIRNERALREIREYIAQNPANWDIDPYRDA